MRASAMFVAGLHVVRIAPRGMRGQDGDELAKGGPVGVLRHGGQQSRSGGCEGSCRFGREDVA